ncbi:MAG: hypothetical protein AMXMBFR49_19790 [Chlorobiota bacterium]
MRAKSNIADFSGVHTYAPKRDFFHNEIEPDASSGEYVIDVDTTMLGTRHLTRYDSLDIGVINIEANNNFYFQIDWAGNADLYLDKITVFNTDYEALYEDSTVTMDQIEDDLEAKYPNPDFSANLQSFYYDEPFQLSARYRGEVQDLVRPYFSGKSYFEVNGAVGGLPKYFMDFDTAYAKATDGFIRRYLNYNMYPIDKNTDTLTASIQDRLDLFINYNWLADDDGTHNDPDKYKYVGILPAQISAQESGVPLVVTICVAAEQYVSNSGGILSLVDGPHRRRPPTPNEIKAMGNISLAYGAKGFMYYMVPTRAAQPSLGGTVFNQYGLYEEANFAFNPSIPATWVQDPDQLQVPNNRYTAVQEFISSTSLVDSTLLRLRWLGADGWSRNDQSGVTWIKSCSTSTSPIFSANSNDADVYVETGYFDEDPNLAGYNQHAKYIYVVNRRCNWQGTDTSNRFIRLKIDSTVASHCSNILVTNLKTGQKYYTTKNSNLDLYLKAGDGTLLKFEPRFVHGGTLVVDEFISEGIYEVDTTLIVPDNVKLTINAGAKLTFQNSGKLLIEDGELEVKGTTNNKVEFDFVAKNWSAANGIFAYRTPLKISNAIIKNASCGIYSHISPGDTIDGVSTENTHTGISLYYSYNYGSDNTVIRNSSFEDSQLWGITMVGSRPRIHSNWFTNITEKAISASTGSAPILLRAADTVGNNRFQLNGTSIYAINSIPLLGTMDDKENYIGGNCFYEDTTSLKVVFENYQTADISAYGNDWATEDPSEFRIELVGDVTVQTDGYNSDCSGIWSNPNMLSGGSSSPKQMESGGDPDSLKSLIKDVRRMIAHGQLRDALVVLTDIINGTADVRYKKSAVSLIPQCYEYVNMSELKSNLLSIRNVGGLFKFTTRLLMNIDTENMDTYKQEILNAGNNKAYGAGDNSEEVMMIYNNLLEEKYKSSGVIDTVGKVTPILTYLNSNFPTSEYTKSANLLFSVLPEGNPANKPMGKQHPGGNKPETVVYEYSLYNNYPNPFNPETVIKFSLKEKSSVTLNVYNIAGQKVEQLISGEMEKGFYEKRFNGTNFSSGVYIFRIEAQSLESKTIYSKTMKAMLLK